MKIQEVLLRAMAKKITWWQAAEIIGVTDRTMRRWRERIEQEGYSGLADRRKGKPSAKRVPLKTAEQVLRLYGEVYFDLNIRHFHEKLGEEHAIELSFGSKHRWLNDGRWYDLIVILDDANSEIYYAQLVEEESTRTVMAALRQVVEKQGLFCALYSDRGSHFFVTPKAGERVDKQRPTQVGRAMKELGVQMIAAYSPQARGRSERSFGTWQGLLPQELRLAKISTMEEANRFLKERYIAEFNTKFTVAAAEKGTDFRRCSRSDLDWVFTLQTERVVAKDNPVAIASRSWQIDKARFKNTLAGSTVTIHEHLDGCISLRFGPHVIGSFHSDGTSRKNKTTERGGKGGSMEAGENQNQVSTASHTPLEISPTARDSHFPSAPTPVTVVKKRKNQAAHAA